MQNAKLAPVGFVLIPVCLWFFFHQLLVSDEKPQAPVPVTTQAASAANDDYEEYQRNIAIRDCSQEYIASMLKSPSTADHGLGTITKFSEDKYFLTSYVDAQNAYGAMMRADYVCGVQLSGRECVDVSCEFVE